MPAGIDIYNVIRTKGTFSNLLQKRVKSDENDQSLLDLAVKRRQDAIQIAKNMVKEKLALELDAVVDNYVAENPQIKGESYIAIIGSGENFAVEVVNIEEAIDAVDDMSKEEAEQILKQKPIGYFANSEDFGLKTKQEDVYIQLREKVQEYFNQNSSIFNCLRNGNII